MIKAGSKEHRKHIGIRNKVSREGALPEELYIKLTKVIHQLYQWGVPVNGAIEIGQVIVDNYWRKKNADKGKGRYMKKDEWLSWWLNRVKTTRFDPEDLHDMFICKINTDYAKGLAPVESANECLEIIEDFIVRYSEMKKC